MTARLRPSQRADVAALIGGVGAASIGIVMLHAGGAPTSYAIANAAAAGAGLLLAALLLRIPRRAEGPLALAAALALLATASWGTEIEGVRRWVALPGAIQVQPALMLLPLLLAMYARRAGDLWHAAAMLLAAVAIATQPDRSMAIAMALVAVAMWLTSRTRITLLVLGAAALSLVATWARPDPLAGVTFVEWVIADGWQAGPVRGAILSLGALAMIAPLLALPAASAEQRRAIIAFALCWGGLMLASLIGPYPTPLLGYGASGIIGYFVSLIALRQSAPATKVD